MFSTLVFQLLCCLGVEIDSARRVPKLKILSLSEHVENCNFSNKVANVIDPWWPCNVLSSFSCCKVFLIWVLPYAWFTIKICLMLSFAQFLCDQPISMNQFYFRLNSLWKMFSWKFVRTFVLWLYLYAMYN